MFTANSSAITVNEPCGSIESFDASNIVSAYDFHCGYLMQAKFVSAQKVNASVTDLVWDVNEMEIYYKGKSVNYFLQAKITMLQGEVKLHLFVKLENPF